MDLEEGSSRTGRGMKSLDSLYRYGFIIIKQISKTNIPPNELRLIQAFQEKNINISMVFLKYITCGRVDRLPQHSALAKWLTHRTLTPLCVGSNPTCAALHRVYIFFLMQIGFSFFFFYVSPYTTYRNGDD